MKDKISAGQSAVITVGESTVEVKIVDDKLVDAVTGAEITTGNVGDYGYIIHVKNNNANAQTGFEVSGSYTVVKTASKTWTEGFDTELGAEAYEKTVNNISMPLFVNGYNSVHGSGPESVEGFFTGQWGGTYSGYQLVGSASYDGPGISSYRNPNGDIYGWVPFVGTVKIYEDYDYTYSKTATVRYEEVKSKTFDKHELLGFLDDMSEDEVIELAKSKIAAEGGVMLRKVNFDFNAGKITVLYVHGESKKDIEVSVTDRNDLNAAFGAELAKQGIDANRVDTDKAGAKAVYVDSTGAKTYNATYSTFGYKRVNFNLKSVSSPIATIISTRTWSATDEINKIAGQTVTEYRNDNWYSGDVILSTKEKKAGENNFTYTTDGKGGDKNVKVINGQKEKEVDFSADLNAGIAKLAKYNDSLTAIQEAEAKVLAAEKEVVELEKAINAIKFGNNDSSLEALQGRLVTAQNDLNTAKQNLIALQGLRDARIAALTSAPSGEGGGETGGEGGAILPEQQFFFPVQKHLSTKRHFHGGGYSSSQFSAEQVMQCTRSFRPKRTRRQLTKI